MKLKDDARFSTICIHAGQEPDPATGAIMTPIYQTSTYVQDGLGQPHAGFEYGRTQNPTRMALERNVAAIEAGTAAFAFASGMAAIDTLLTRLSAGDHVLVSDNTYGGTFRLFERVRRKFGLDFTYVDTSKPELVEPAITANTKIIYLANPNNPTGTIFTRQEFQEFYAHVPERVLIILDEAYFEYAQDNPKYPDSMHYRHDNVITLRTFSKVYGLAGVRIGYGFAHEVLIRNLLKVKLPFEPSTIAQAAGIAIFLEVGRVVDIAVPRKNLVMPHRLENRLALGRIVRKRLVRDVGQSKLLDEHRAQSVIVRARQMVEPVVVADQIQRSDGHRHVVGMSVDLACARASRDPDRRLSSFALV